MTFILKYIPSMMSRLPGFPPFLATSSLLWLFPPHSCNTLTLESWGFGPWSMFITRLIAVEIPSVFIDSGTCCLLTYSVFLITVGYFTNWLENVLFRVFDPSDVNLICMSWAYTLWFSIGLLCVPFIFALFRVNHAFKITLLLCHLS